MHADGGNVKKKKLLLSQTIDKFMADTCMSHAAALSFYVILSIIPLLFVLISIGSYIMGSTANFLSYVMTLLEQVIPDLPHAVAGNVEHLLEKRSTIGAIGFVFLLFASDLALLEAKRSLDVIFGTEKRGNPIFIKGKSMVVVFVGGVIVSFLFIITPIFRVLIKMNLPYISTTLYFIAGIISTRLFSFFMIFLLFTAAYALLPSRKIGGRYIVLAGGLTTVLWVIVRVLFSWYLSHHSNIDIVYGSLAAIIIGILWVYYTSLIFLFSAEFVSSMLKKENGIEKAVPDTH